MKSEYTAKSVYDKSESLRSSLQFNTAAVGKELAAGFAKSVDSFRVFMINSTAGLSTAVGATFTAVDSIVPVTGERAGDNACATNISLGQLNSANLKSKYEAQAELLGYLKLRDGQKHFLCRNPLFSMMEKLPGIGKMAKTCFPLLFLVTETKPTTAMFATKSTEVTRNKLFLQWIRSF
jgi:hypothetical protein